MPRLNTWRSKMCMHILDWMIERCTCVAAACSDARLHLGLCVHLASLPYIPWCGRMNAFAKWVRDRSGGLMNAMPLLRMHAGADFTTEGTCPFGWTTGG